VRKPAVAGTFYPGETEELRQVIERMLDDVPQRPLEGDLVALISPHAGYPYSGSVAAYGYSKLKRNQFQRVVVISPSHIDSFQGAAVYNGDGYETPLGIIPVDIEFAKALSEKSSRIQYSDRGHKTGMMGRGEHALEVQLPFLQVVLGEFKLVPIIMGEQSIETCRSLSRALADLIIEQDTLIVASSDLSHFHSYDEAVELDRKVTNAIQHWDYLSLSQNLASRKWEACGGGPIVAAMMAAEKLGANKSEILRYANSGDVLYGDRGRVVGYTSAALTRKKGIVSGTYVIELTDKDKQELFQIARASIREIVTKGRPAKIDPPSSPALLEEAAVFVTLKIHRQLRGCVGSIIATESLYQAVASSAVNAAINDRRFRPVSVSEIDDLEYEISVLSPFRRISDMSQIEVGKHGILMEKGPYRGLLLPQVATANGWDRETFLEHTCLKAGLPRDAWKNSDIDVLIFSANVFGEGE
jgi:AmmeMemoRadiSam system protein B/AmmeMemoRadiSam system protein A